MADHTTHTETISVKEGDIMKVGFIGLGSMGAGMSRNLIKARHDLVVYNRTRSRAQEMQSLGAKVADTPSEAAAGVEAHITMLANDRAVQDVMFEPGRAIESLPERAVYISMSTISVDLSRRLAQSHAEKRQNYIAAPVFGRPARFAQYLNAVQQLDDLAQKRYGKHVMDLAVRWVLDQPGITAALWGARHPGELEAVAGALDWPLDADAHAAIDQILRKTIANPIGPEFMAPPARNAVAA
jgi:hypothetical protein